MPFLPCTRRNSLLISLSTFRSARTLILWTSWISSSTSPSIISALRTWHSAASSVIRIGSARRGEVGRVHLHRPGPPPGHDLLRHSLEQAVGQLHRLDPIQLARSRPAACPAGSTPGPPSAPAGSPACRRPGPPSSAPPVAISSSSLPIDSAASRPWVRLGEAAARTSTRPHPAAARSGPAPAARSSPHGSAPAARSAAGPATSPSGRCRRPATRSACPRRRPSARGTRGTPGSVARWLVACREAKPYSANSAGPTFT